MDVEPRIVRRRFGRAPWGPAHLVSRPGDTSVRLGDGPTVSMRPYGVRPVTPTMGYGGTLVAGVPVLVDGVQEATAYPRGRAWAGSWNPARAGARATARISRRRVCTSAGTCCLSGCR